jgi:transporter family-2 protein
VVLVFIFPNRNQNRLAVDTLPASGQKSENITRKGVQAMEKFHYMLLSMAAGILMPLQAGINNRLGEAAGGPIASAFISFFVGTLALGVYLLVFRIPLPLGRAMAVTPWWYWIGGTLGAFFVAASIVLVPRLGATAMLGFILAGQMLASLVLDQYGLLGFAHIPIDARRLAGVGLLAVGVYLVRG